MLSSPRRPSSTMRIFSSAEWCRRVARRISRTVFSALSGMRLLACLIVAPQQGYDEPGILSYAIKPLCPTSADGLQLLNGFVSMELARVDSSIATFWGVHTGLAAGSIYLCGGEEQKQRWL